MFVVTIDESKCKVCGECVSMCPVEIFKIENNRLIVGNTEECANCQSCTSVCEPQAITISEV